MLILQVHHTRSYHDNANYPTTVLEQRVSLPRKPTPISLIPIRNSDAVYGNRLLIPTNFHAWISDLVSPPIRSGFNYNHISRSQPIRHLCLNGHNLDVF